GSTTVTVHHRLTKSSIAHRRIKGEYDTSASASEKTHLVVGPLRIEPRQPAASLCFHERWRDRPEFFSRRKLRFAPSLAPDVGDSSQLLDGQAEASSHAGEIGSRLDSTSKHIQFLHGAVSPTFSGVDSPDPVFRPLGRVDPLPIANQRFV